MQDNSGAGDPALYEALLQVLGQQGISHDAGVAQAHAGDWSEAPRVPPALVLLPRTPPEVARTLAVLNRFGQRVAVQGGLTGLAGGATPQPGEVSLSLARLNQVETLDLVGGTVTLQAGVVLEQLQAQVEAQGWFFPLDLGARGSCQVGGNAATNAGGNRVIRYGTMRELILGIEVALPDGTLLSMLNRVTKNTTGIDLKQLFIGSEGTLGVITRLVLKLSPRPLSTHTALCALRSFDAAAALLREMRRALPTLSAFELMWAGFVDSAMAITGSRAPFDERYPIYVLVETLGASDQTDRAMLETLLEGALEQELLADVIVAQSIEHARQLWRYREAIGELLAALKPHAAFDVGIPMAAMEGFVTALTAQLEQAFPAQSHLFFGHIGDGNLHVLSGPYREAGMLHAVERMVYAAVEAAGGCISAEHGIGTVKKEFLHHSRSAAELAVMRDLKRVFDPGQILNPGRIFDARAS